MDIEEQVNMEYLDVDREDAKEFMRQYLTTGQNALRVNRSIQDDRRFLVYENGSSLEALEEKGEWNKHGFVAVPENEYYYLEENDRMVEREEISWEHTNECLM